VSSGPDGTPGKSSPWLERPSQGSPQEFAADDIVMLRSSGSARLPPPVPPFPPALAHNRTDEWPLRTFLELGALPGAVPCARLHARQMLWEWSLTRLSESVELLVSELVTNAVAASRSMVQTLPVRLWLLAGTTQVLVMVWDANPRPPAQAEAGDDAENGRGLLLVDAMSKRWDWYFPREGTGGKVVWALAAYGPKQ
jgi:anti-sigma regulatory factor (Ser/Thr protein kinase)